MKKTIIIGLLLFQTFLGAQVFSFGVRGGLNFASTGDLKTDTKDAIKLTSDKRTGYHLGVWGRADLSSIGIYLQPELSYTRLQTKYNVAKYNLDKLNMPVLVGVKVLKMGRVFAGPSFQYLLNENFKRDVKNIHSDDFSVGLQFGVGIEINRFGIDIRYDRALNKIESKFVNKQTNDIFRIDSRPTQINIGITYRLTAKK